MKNTLVGIRPTGFPHIGHYASIIKPALEEDATVLIAEYHAPDRLVDLESFVNILRRFGIQQIFLQSVLFDPVLYFELLSLAKDGELRRMTQYKASKPRERTAHLYTYPVLMAHDIAGYKRVIVGEDQRQHLEFGKVLLRRHNHNFDTDIRIPRGDYRGGRIMSLTNPIVKMSKSDPLGCIFLHDSPARIHNKFQRAVTNPEGVLNLMNIWNTFDGGDLPEDIDSTQMERFKALVAKKVIEKLYDKNTK